MDISKVFNVLKTGRTNGSKKPETNKINESGKNPKIERQLPEEREVITTKECQGQLKGTSGNNVDTPIKNFLKKNKPPSPVDEGINKDEILPLTYLGIFYLSIVPYSFGILVYKTNPSIFLSIVYLITICIFYAIMSAVAESNKQKESEPKEVTIARIIMAAVVNFILALNSAFVVLLINSLFQSNIAVAISICFAYLLINITFSRFKPETILAVYPITFVNIVTYSILFTIFLFMDVFMIIAMLFISLFLNYFIAKHFVNPTLEQYKK